MARKQQKRRKIAGFSLIEMMVAIFIFANCMMFIIGVFPTAVAASNQGKNTLLANQVAQKEMEYLKSLPWEKLENFQTLVVTEPDTYYRNTTLSSVIRGTKHYVTYESMPVITPFSMGADGRPDILDIRVKVKYKYGSAVLKNPDEYYRSVDLETLVNRPVGY